MSIDDIAATAKAWLPDVLFIGHGGSTSAHPTVAAICRAVKQVLPSLRIVYGGVYPTYHAAEVLSAHPEIDFIVRGEGEATAVRLLDALLSGAPLRDVPGIAYRERGVPALTAPAPVISNLDECRVGWELIEDWDRYQYWGVGRAAVFQFSRGCPHPCSYCGQRGFWTKWRSRDPQRAAAEIARLHRTYGVRFVDLADENPTTSKQRWRAFLEALIAENVPVKLIGTIRATDIVRDADILHLYKKAGFARILLGVETTDALTLERLRKGSAPPTDMQAIRLLREHDILSQAAYVVGFEEETDRDYWRGLRQLVAYDPDQINAMYVTPHRWTPFFRESAGRRVMETDPAKWDYRHQVLATKVPPWRVFLWVKATETVLQLRPRALWRVLAHRDPEIRQALRWNYGVGRRAFLFEIREFVRRRLLAPASGALPTLEAFWGAPQDHQQESMRKRSVLEAVSL